MPDDKNPSPLSLKATDTRDWYAWSPTPDEFHIIGEVQIPHPGIDLSLTPKSTQNDPSILLLDLNLKQRDGAWPMVPTWKNAALQKAPLTSVQVFYQGTKVADIPVRTVASTSGAESAAAKS